MYKVGIDKYCLTGSLEKEYPTPISYRLKQRLLRVYLDGIGNLLRISLAGSYLFAYCIKN